MSSQYISELFCWPLFEQGNGGAGWPSSQSSDTTDDIASPMSNASFSSGSGNAAQGSGGITPIGQLPVILSISGPLTARALDYVTDLLGLYPVQPPYWAPQNFVDQSDAYPPAELMQQPSSSHWQPERQGPEVPVPSPVLYLLDTNRRKPGDLALQVIDPGAGQGIQVSGLLQEIPTQGFPFTAPEEENWALWDTHGFFSIAGGGCVVGDAPSSSVP
ncbi:hypothetical protein K488DRAFT_70297 [Vararia minispora EC-137]|uniref:Uncharacterized protein n=1 Tax=Vararia minispora EC-137 TaxID=1314806 RepID=A0ACB8QN79_9AGAM|nr:hypothetical protein K488DRAFT_70297 [Vararia minispora EC-137]